MEKILINLTALAFMVLFSAVTFAQNQKNTAQIIITWQANNFYPANYLSKALVTKDTQVIVSAEVVEQNKFVDLSKTNLTWYVDDEIKNSGQNIKEIAFAAQKPEGDSHFVRVTVEKVGGRDLETSIRIPVSRHLIVLETPYPDQLIRTETKTQIQAVPYFFNISSLTDLNFSWQVNDKSLETGNDNQLFLNLGRPKTNEQREIQIHVSVQNQRNQLEFAEMRAKLTLLNR